MEECLKWAKKTESKIELEVDQTMLCELEGLHGEKPLRDLYEKTGKLLYGFVMESSADLRMEGMLAKKAVNILNRMCGSMLRIVFRPRADISRKKYFGQIAAFLNSLSVFASYSAGGGEEKSTVRICYDLRSIPEITVQEYLGLNQQMLKSRNISPVLSLDTEQKQVITGLLERVNGYEMNLFGFTCTSLEFCDETLIGQIARRCDYPVYLEGNPKDAEKFNGVKFDNSLIDYTKRKYPSSVARYIKHFVSAGVEPMQVIAGSQVCFEVTYTLCCEIKTGGGIRFTFNHATDWQGFCADDVENAGYFYVESDGCRFETKVLSLDACIYACAILKEGKLSEGAVVKFIFPNSMRAQTFSTADNRIYTQVDTEGENIWFEEDFQPKMKVLPDQFDHFVVIAPSVARPGEKIRIRARAEDIHNNVLEEFTEIPQLFLEEGVQISGKREDGAVFRYEACFREEGIYRPMLVTTKGKSFLCNYIKVSQNAEKVYFGDIHGHLSYMDGYGEVDEYYNYAENKAFLDFTCHSEHIDSYSGGRQASNEAQWEIIRQNANKYNRAYEFPVLLGYENSEYWDANVYFEEDCESYFVASFGNKLFDFAKAHHATVIPHMTTYPQRRRGYDWNTFDSEAVKVMEIYSCHGSNEYFGTDKMLMNCEPGGYALDALNMGYKIGFIGSGDGHVCRPGNTRLLKQGYMNGLVAVYPEEYTRKGIVRSIKARHCYATTNSRILVYFSLNGSRCGSEITVQEDKAECTYEIYGTDKFKSVDCILNGEIVFSFGNGRDQITGNFFVHGLKEGHNYCYLRGEQQDGEMFWISPIFVNYKKIHL